MVLYQYSNRQRNQGTKQSPEADPEIYENLVYDKDGILSQ